MILLGLLLIVGAWGIQLLGNATKLKKEFIVIYAIGSGILAYDGYMAGQFSIAILNAVVGILAMGIFTKLKK